MHCDQLYAIHSQFEYWLSPPVIPVLAGGAFVWVSFSWILQWPAEDQLYTEVLQLLWIEPILAQRYCIQHVPWAWSACWAGLEDSNEL